MTIAERMLRCRVIEKMEQNTEYARRLGLVNSSSFRENNNLFYEQKKKSEVGK